MFLIRLLSFEIRGLKMQDAKKERNHPIVTLFFYSAIGIFVFFIPAPLGGRTTIPLDHIVTNIREHFPGIAAIYALLVVLAGSIFPFLQRTWRKDNVTVVFSLLKILGAVISVMYFTRFGPAWFFEKDLTPFLFEKLVIPVGIIVPVGAIFLAFLVEFGFLEFIGVLMQPVMRPVWKTPGRSAVDALASFVGSYSIALLITNRVFKEGKYSVKEATIIATGFSTVSATFMIIVAKTTGLMEMWNLYFWSTLAITFTVTAITVRLYPLRQKNDKNAATSASKAGDTDGNRLKRALDAGVRSLHSAPGVLTGIRENLWDGFKMAMSILPTIMSVGLLGLLLAKYTPVFDVAGYLFWPVAKLMQLPEAFLAAKATAIGISEMFLPALLVVDASLAVRYVIAVVSVSSILFFSASIPCILATEIPISLKDIVIIWFQRALLSLILASAVAKLIF